MNHPVNQVMVIDDEASIREAIEQWLQLSGYGVELHERPEQALQALQTDFPGVILSDVRMPGMDGLALLERIHQLDPDLPVILLTGHGDVAMAVQAMRQGAYDFLEKPFSPEALLGSLKRAMEKRRLVLDNRQLQQQARGGNPLAGRLLGNSPAMVSLREQIAELAEMPVNVLLRGETGSGKEIVARCLHDFGPRRSKPFVALNCAAIPDSLFEAELFGHESGAFTGAQGKRIGKLEHAHEGTLFLDEIESMPLAQQAKLLRVLQDRQLERLGSNRSIQVDLRIVAATKPDLLEIARAGQFREDLVYRLNVAELHIPPLRERREDIPLLFEHFAWAAAARLERDPRPLEPEQLDRLMQHDWPGNVRELANAAERYSLGLLAAEPMAASEAPSLAERMEAYEAQCLRQALSHHQGDIKAVMAELQLPRRTLNEKMQRHGLQRSDFLAEE